VEITGCLFFVKWLKYIKKHNKEGSVTFISYGEFLFPNSKVNQKQQKKNNHQSDNQRVNVVIHVKD